MERPHFHDKVVGHTSLQEQKAIEEDLIRNYAIDPQENTLIFL